MHEVREGGNGVAIAPYIHTINPALKTTPSLERGITTSPQIPKPQGYKHTPPKPMGYTDPIPERLPDVPQWKPQTV